MIKSDFFDVILGISILQKYIPVKSCKNTSRKNYTLTKSLLMIFIMIKLGFLCEKKILARLKQKIIASMCFVIKTSRFFQSTFQIKNVKTRWIYYLSLMVINCILCISKILTDLCFTKRKIKTNTLVKVVCSFLVVKMCIKFQQKCAKISALMVHNL